MQINLLPVYSKLAGPDVVPQEIVSRLPQDMPLSLHQVKTYKALLDTNTDVVINTAMTGDGKSLAAYLPTLINVRRQAFGMYPTIELSRDQQRQFEAYAANFGRTIRSDALWGARLGELMRERSAKRRGGCHTESCVTMYNEKALNLVQTWLPDFSALCHSATFGMASVLKGRSVVPIMRKRDC
jgi:ATP-dependent helicase YprA (DUF1998 family)